MKLRPTKIKPLKFRVRGYILNEYEFLQFRYDVARGIFPPCKVTCINTGKSCKVLRDGTLNDDIYVDILANIMIEHFKFNRYAKFCTS